MFIQGPYNYKIKSITKAKFAQRAVEVPMKSPFWDRLKWQFKNCIIEDTNQGYLKFVEPKTGSKRIDILDMVTFATTHLEGKHSCGASSSVGGIKKKKHKGVARNVLTIR